MNKILLLVYTAIFCQSLASAAQLAVATNQSVEETTNIAYQLSFPNFNHHELEVILWITNLKPGPLQLRMSRASAGRYGTHEFAKNMYNLQAFDVVRNTVTLTKKQAGYLIDNFQTSKKLTTKQIEADVYEIAQHGDKVKIQYTLYGHTIDGTYLGIDETHAHINMPATILWAIGLEKEPIQIRFELPINVDWEIATQLKPISDSTMVSYWAPNLTYLMDSPVELSQHKSISIAWGKRKSTQTLTLVSHSNDDDTTLINYFNQIKQIVAEQEVIFGELPKFDYGTYTFIQDIGSDTQIDGMSHRNSAVITSNIDGLSHQNNKSLLEIVAHEFFHIWNGARIKPKSLEPFHLEKTSLCSELWFSEGFTQYYGDLTLARVGIFSQEDYLKKMSTMLSEVLGSPGAKIYSPEQMSRYAAFADTGVGGSTNTNQVNIYTSYHYYGAIIALALDLRLRTEFKLDLDGYLKHLWKRYGKTKNAYTSDDLQLTLAAYTHNAKFAHEFFKNYIWGTQKNDYDKLLSRVGLKLTKANTDKAWLGTLKFNFTKTQTTVVSNALFGQPIYKTGIDIGDTILSIDGIEIKDAAVYEDILAQRKPGDELSIMYNHRGQKKMANLFLDEDPTLKIVSFEELKLPITEKMKTFRTEWLASKVVAKNQQ